MLNEYELQAKKFLKNTNTKMSITYVDCSIPKNWNDGQYHNRYRISIKRNNQSMSFYFYDSVFNTQKGNRPTSYDVLSCLEKYEVSSDTQDFAKDFGYEINNKEDYKRVKKICNAVNKEYKNVIRVFGDVMEELEKIQ